MFFGDYAGIGGPGYVAVVGFRSPEAMLTSLPDLYPLMAAASAFPPVAHLPPLSVLTSIKVTIYSGSLSARLAEFLSCIPSAPALSSVTFKYSKATPAEDIPASRPWITVDKWLARLAMHAKAKGSLTLVLTPWPEGNSKWEECLPEFREAGGELNVITGARKWYD